MKTKINVRGWRYAIYPNQTNEEDLKETEVANLKAGYPVYHK